MKRMPSILSLLFLFTINYWTISCQKDNDILHGDVAPLVFSTDTVSFDTVFCTMGSTTRRTTVYNTSDSKVVLSKVTLLQGRASRFRVNVDGDTSMVARHLEIDAHDSIFVFIQVNVNPNSSREPFIVDDELLFDVEGCRPQSLHLRAYGRNAVYHTPQRTLCNVDGEPYIDRYGNHYDYSVINCSQWDHSLPHVIVGYAVVDEDSVLNLTAGDELYFANDAVLWVFNGGTLHVDGSAESPVLFTSIRQDGYYKSLPGQWGHIWLGGISGGGSKDCVFNHARIENSYYGIIADSCAYDTPTLVITKSEIEHIKVAGIQADDAVIYCEELLIADCGGATFYAPYGGIYYFRYLTSANYWNFTHRTTPSVILSNSYDYGSGVLLRDLTEAVFQDCIIYGNYREPEMLVFASDEAECNVYVGNCLIKGGSWDQDPLFRNPRNDDYRLLRHSPAWSIGYYHQPDYMGPDTVPVVPINLHNGSLQRLSSAPRLVY